MNSYVEAWVLRIPEDRETRIAQVANAIVNPTIAQQQRRRGLFSGSSGLDFPLCKKFAKQCNGCALKGLT